MRHRPTASMMESIESMTDCAGVASTPMRSAQVLLSHAGRQELAVIETLRCYEEELRHLRAENEQLRRSAQAFGELAERLNIALRMVATSMPGDGAETDPPN